jgi:hypothetical protein
MTELSPDAWGFRDPVGPSRSLTAMSEIRRWARTTEVGGLFQVVVMKGGSGRWQRILGTSSSLPAVLTIRISDTVTYHIRISDDSESHRPEADADTQAPPHSRDHRDGTDNHERWDRQVSATWEHGILSHMGYGGHDRI